MLGDTWADYRVPEPNSHVVEIADSVAFEDSVTVEVLPMDEVEAGHLSREILGVVYATFAVAYLVGTGQGWDYSWTFAIIPVAREIWTRLEKAFPDLFGSDEEE